MQITLALWQSNIISGDPARNLQAIENQAKEASGNGANILVLPELCLHGYHKESIQSKPEYHLAGILPRLQSIASGCNLMIAGSFVDTLDTGRANTMVVVDADGNLAGKYQKTHLFKMLNEDKYFMRGNSLTVVDTPFGKIGLAICYDLRFPEIFRAMVRRGAEGFILCAEWPEARINHWKTMLQARAIENQAWIAACNCCGTTGKVAFGGASAVISPWGEMVCADGSETLFYGQVDSGLIGRIRSENPFLEDYREDIL